MRAAVLISGGGSNLQSIIDHSRDGRIELQVAGVISNVADVKGLERAAEAGIDAQVIRNADFKSREAFDDALMQAIDPLQPDVVILAGFMRILTPAFVEHYRGRLLNIHPSLLPDYPGLNTHQRVLDANEEWHGCTVHFVTAELDAGPAILQGRLRVHRGESAAELASRVLEIEHQVYPAAADLVASGRVTFERDGAALDGTRLERPLRYPDDLS